MISKSVLVIGSGPIIIGQAAEFDYAGAQACKSLREEGYKVILLNSNPATIMTDTDIADRVYIEPLTVEIVEDILIKEKPFGILGTLGGQTGLNLTSELHKRGILDKYNVKILGTSVESIEVAEDRDKFRSFLLDINQPVPPSEAVNNYIDALNAAEEIGYPVVVRPAYTLGGTGGGIANNKSELKDIVNSGIALSRVGQVLIEKSLFGWKEIEYEVMRDNNGNVITICNMENIDPMGVHTGDSIVVAPSQTLNDKEYQMLRTASLEIITNLNIKGGCNVQLALKPSKIVKESIGDDFSEDPEYYVIEVNPRVSRSSALASKATGYPIARIASKIAVGKNLDEITNPVTGKTFSVFEPSLDYCVVKIPRWPFDKFPNGNRTLGTQMKATGEVMGIERSFEAALLKSIRSLENNKPDLMCESDILDNNEPTDDRLWILAERLRNGSDALEETKRTYIDYWFTSALEKIIDMEKEIKKNKLDFNLLSRAKAMGFADAYIAKIKNLSESNVRNIRKKLNILPTFKMVDTCAAEFEAITTYFYSTYDEENEAIPLSGEKALVLGSGPIRIGQGIEFDYCSVHASISLKENGVKSILINSNPETVSTDFDTSSRLYFEPLDSESILDILENESADSNLISTLVQFGGQTAINMSQELGKNNAPILGSNAEVINLASDRSEFEAIAKKSLVRQPAGGSVTKLNDAKKIAKKVGYPVILRPSYVLGGRAMEIIYSERDLSSYFKRAQSFVSGQSILVDQYINGIEIEVDALCDTEEILIPGIMQHVERAGIHSGDSIAIYPAFDLSHEEKNAIVDATKSLGKTLGIKGLMNIQFIVKRDDKSKFTLFVIEVNPRSSRTIPFISKVTGVPMVKLATRIMLNEKLSNLGYGIGLRDNLNLFAVKAPVFSMSKLSGVDTFLGPEMKSTGEVMGFDKDFGMAFAKSQIAAANSLPTKGLAFISLKDSHKVEGVDLAKQLLKLNFILCGTGGTADFIRKHGMNCKKINKVSGGSPHIVDVLNSKKIALVINTGGGRSEHRLNDAIALRRATLINKVPYCTNMSTAQACLKGIKSLKTKKITVTSLQDI